MEKAALKCPKSLYIKHLSNYLNQDLPTNYFKEPFFPIYDF